MTEYVELHAASAFSFLEGASQPEGLIKSAVKCNIPAMALLDHNGVYGAARFHTSAEQNGVRAHIGAEVSTRNFGLRLTPPVWLPSQHTEEMTRVPLLCASRTGYQNLCQLITRFKMREATKSEGAATLDDLAEFSAGLVCLTGGDEGPLAAALAEGGERAGRGVLEQLIHCFGRNNVYVELQRHGERAEEWRNQAAISLASSLRLPLLATNGVRYATQYEREVLDVFTAIRHKTNPECAGRLLACNSQRQICSARAMRSLFSDLPEAVDNTLLLSSRLEFSLKDLGYEFPVYATPTGEPMASFLRKRVREGIQRRYGPKHDADLVARAQKQTERELALINDEETFDTLCRADTVGMFQVESRAQMASITRNAPRRFYDLVVQVAIIRPGPIVGKMMHPYMCRRQGKEEPMCILPELEPVLKRTLGVPLFQEQLLRMAMVVGNFSGAEAEGLRKAVGMRRSWARMEELMVKLRAGMSAKRIDEATQKHIVQSIQSFALYGFPESHAASFALLPYASAYFKVKYLAAFTCAMLNNQPMGFYSPAVLVKDAQRHGLRVKPVDVQISEWDCTIEHEPDGQLSLRLGLRYVRGLKQADALE